MNSSAFARRSARGVVHYGIPFLEESGLVKAVFSTRLGGVSTGETARMNLGMHRQDAPDNVRENYRLLLSAAGMEPENLVVTRQVHETHVIKAPEQWRGRGVWNDAAVEAADGLICDQPGTVLIKHSADCAAIYLLDTRKPAIGLLHSGWRGTLNNIARAGIDAMTRAYGTRPQDIRAAISPAIGPCCFEVGEDVAKLFADAYPEWPLVIRAGEKPRVDLWRCIALQLEHAGIAPGNIAQAGLCTACHPNEFHSHRYRQGHCGLMAAAITLV